MGEPNPDKHNAYRDSGTGSSGVHFKKPVYGGYSSASAMGVRVPHSFQGSRRPRTAPLHSTLRQRMEAWRQRQHGKQNTLSDKSAEPT